MHVAARAPSRSETSEHEESEEYAVFRGEAPLRFECTDLGNAERFVARHRRSVRYCRPRKTWLVWSNNRWRWDDEGMVLRVAKLTVRSIYGEAADAESDEERKAIVRHARASESVGKLRAMLELAESEAGIPISASELDADPWLFNVANGTIDLRTGKLRPHRREDMITKLAPVTFDPNAAHVLWTRFLSEATGADPEFTAYLQRVAGYAMTGCATEKKFFFAHGPRNTCKSTFLDALATAFGDYHVGTSFETWLARPNVGGNRGDLVRCMGARLVTSSETKKGAKFDEELMRRVTGGDPIVAAAKYEAEIEFRPSFTILLAANDAPKIRDDDDALWSRVALLPFTHPIAHPDPGVKNQLRDPLELGPAILAWCVSGCLAWQASGLGQARAVDAASDAYRAEQDPLRDFFEERCVFEPGAKVTRKALRHAYEEYAQAEGIKYPMGHRDFSQRIETRAAVIKLRDDVGASVRGWDGVRLKTSYERGQ